MTRIVTPRAGAARRRRGRALAPALAPLIALLSIPAPAPASAPPTRSEPASRADAGPAYPHAAVSRYEFGDGPRSYWLFEPAGPTPELAPVVVFHHGWMSMNPGIYGAYIEHLVRLGHVVVFPRYQTDVFTEPALFLPNALASIRDALDVLATSPDHVRPDRSRFALIGHSAGGNLAALVAASAADHDLPAPRAVVALLPGEVKSVPGPSLAQIPAETLLVVVAAEHDVVVGDDRARRIFAEASAVPAARKKFVLFRTDRRGLPWLIADHFAPTAASPRLDNGDGPFRLFQMAKAELNALDRAGFWPLTERTLEAAFAGQSLDEAVALDHSFLRLGYWSDGRAVLRPIVGDDLKEIPRVLPPGGLRLIPTRPQITAADPERGVVK